MADRLALFLDYQNVYKCAREAYELPTAYPSGGQVRPRALGSLIASRLPPGVTTPRELSEVRVYSGRPAQSRDHKGYGAHRAQVATWEKTGVIVVARTLSYSRGFPQEKGIDVNNAIDFVAGALDRRFDVAVLFSTDTDLIPALEFVALRTDVRVEVAKWEAHGNAPLSIDGQQITCHLMDSADYWKVADATNYVPRAKSTARPAL